MYCKVRVDTFIRLADIKEKTGGAINDPPVGRGLFLFNKNNFLKALNLLIFQMR